eukprot:jgi/Undpi1/11929/HiC_scaffold_4.g01628.m1
MATLFKKYHQLNALPRISRGDKFMNMYVHERRARAGQHKGTDSAVDNRESRKAPSQRGVGGDKTKSGENASKSGKGDEKIALPDGTLWDGLGSWEGLGEGLSGQGFEGLNLPAVTDAFWVNFGQIDVPELTLFGLTWPDTKPKKKSSKKATASTAARDGGPAPHHPKTPKSPSNSVSSDERGGESTTKMAGRSGEGGGGKGGGKAGSGGWWTVRLTWGRRKRLKAAAREQASVAEAEAVGVGGTGDGASESAGEEGSREDGESGSRGSSHSGGRRKRGWRKAGAFAALRRRLPSLERDTGSAKASGGGDGERSSQKVRDAATASTLAEPSLSPPQPPPPPPPKWSGSGFRMSGGSILGGGGSADKIPNKKSFDNSGPASTASVNAKPRVGAGGSVPAEGSGAAQATALTVSSAVEKGRTGTGGVGGEGGGNAGGTVKVEGTPVSSPSRTTLGVMGDDEKLSMALPRSKGDGRAGAKGGDSHDGGVGGGKGEDVANGAGGGAGGGGGGIGGEGKGGEVGAFLGRGGWEAAAGTGTERGCDEGVGSTGPKAPVSAAPTKFIPKFAPSANAWRILTNKLPVDKQVGLHNYFLSVTPLLSQEIDYELRVV